MFYIVGIYLNGRNYSSEMFYIEKSTGNLESSYGLPVLRVYDDTDDSVEEITAEYLVHCLELGIMFKGVKITNNERRYSKNENYDTVRLKTVQPPFLDKIRIREYIRVSDKTHMYNKYLLNQLGVSDLNRFAVAGSMERSEGRLIYIDRDGTVSSSSIRNVDRQLYKYKGNVINLGNTLVIDSIGATGSMRCLYAPYDLHNMFNRWQYSVLDVYVLALIAPQYLIGCTIVSDTEFIIDTLTDRYIYNVKPGFKNFILKQKLLGNSIFWNLFQ